MLLKGDLGFKDIPNLSLQEAAEQFLKNPRDEIKEIDQEIHKALSEPYFP